MPRTYQGLGLELLYPENWKINEGEALSVTFESPGGAFMTLTRLPHPDHCADTLQRLARTMESEYEAVETETVRRQVGTMSLEGVTQRFFYLDLLVVSHILTLNCEHYAWLIHYQGEDRDMDALDSVFEAIITQLVRQSSSRR